MSIIAEGPDGAQHEFPDETDPAVIKATLARHYGTPQQPTTAKSISFDDLIPSRDPGNAPASAAGANVSFDDLVPKRSPSSRFEVQGPDGKIYEVVAPDEASAIAAVHGNRSAPAGANPFDALDAPQGQRQTNPFDALDDAPPAREPWQARLADNMRAVAHGATFGASPRIAAALEAATGIGGNFGDYSGNLAHRRAAEEAYAKAHPWLSGIGNFTGGLASTLAGGALLGGPGAAAEAPSIWNQMAHGAGVGAGVGGFQGAMDSPDLTNIPHTATSAIMGAGTGALLGGALPAVGRGLGAGYSAIANRLTSPAELRSRQTQILADALLKDGPQAVQARLGELGPDATLADAGSNLQGTAQGAALNSDKARERLAQTLLSRSEGAPSRIKAATEASFGPYEAPIKAESSLKDALAQADTANYTAALRDPGALPPPVDTSALLAHLDERIPRSEGMEKKALINLRDMLMTPNSAKAEVAPLPEYDAIAGAPSKLPPNLAEFLASRGGVQDGGGDLRSMGLNTAAKGLFNKHGMPMDKAREAAAEAGYLGPGTDHAMANTTPNDLIDALANHPTYSVHDENALNMLHAADDARAARPQGDLTAAQYSAFLQGKAARDMLPDRIPQTNAENLHNIKVELDNLINYDQPALGLPAGAVSRQQGALKEARRLLNNALEDQVPGYRYANRQSAALRERIAAIGEGAHALDTGKTAMSPDVLAERLKQLRAAARGDFATGARGEIERQLATNPDDLRAGLNITKAPDDWNRAKLGLTFGQEPTQNFVNMLDREQTFRDTLKNVVNKADAAQQSSARDAMSPSFFSIPLTKHGAVTTALRMLPLRDYRGSYPAVAEGLAAQGENRDALVKTLLALHEQRAQNAATKAQAGSLAQSLAMGLLAARPNAVGYPKNKDRMAKGLANQHLKKPDSALRWAPLWITQ